MPAFCDDDMTIEVSDERPEVTEGSGSLDAAL